MTFERKCIHLQGTLSAKEPNCNTLISGKIGLKNNEYDGRGEIIFLAKRGEYHHKVAMTNRKTFI